MILKKWELENQKLPRNQQRPLPQKPMIFPSLNGNKSDLERMNQVFFSNFNFQKY